jgi:hypothetical protein
MAVADDLFSSSATNSPAASSLHIYHKDSRIKIYSKFIRVGSTDYSVQHLATVNKVTILPNVLGSVISWGLLGFLVGLLLGIFASVFFGPSGSLFIVLFALAGAGGGAYWAYRRSKPTYAVRFRLTSGDTGSVHSPDAAYIDRIASALTRAMAENQ